MRVICLIPQSVWSENWYHRSANDSPGDENKGSPWRLLLDSAKDFPFGESLRAVTPARLSPKVC